MVLTVIGFIKVSRGCILTEVNVNKPKFICGKRLADVAGSAESMRECKSMS